MSVARLLVRLEGLPVGNRRSSVANLFAALLAVCVVSLTPIAAFSEPPPASIYERDGFYMSARGIYGISYFAFEDSSGSEEGWGFGVSAGYRFLEYFAGEIDMEVMDPGFQAYGQAYRNFGMTLYGKAYPLSLLEPAGNWLDRFQPYVKAGVGFQYWYFKDQDGGFGSAPSGTGFVARFGGGSEIYLTRQLALTVDAVYNVTTGPIRGANSWSIGFFGLLWRFSPN